MLRVITTGEQNFQTLRKNNFFYIDKTKFIKEWWLGGDPVTLITRPRRFGKTLMLDTVKTFFSKEYAGQSELFTGLEIWNDAEFRDLQGTIPVIFLSFADIKSSDFDKTMKLIKARIERIYNLFRSFLDLSTLTDSERKQFDSVSISMDDAIAQDSLLCLSEYLYRQQSVKPIILLDEYDSPLQEAWLNSYWDKLLEFLRGFFNSTFKTNFSLGRALITGITRISKESIFSDMNNIKVVSITSDLYADCFGFTEQEVFSAMDEYGLTEKDKVKKWYDGFIIGNQKEIYNPWSIINYLSEKKFSTYWAYTSSNAFVGELIANGNDIVKEETERLLHDKSVITKLDEQVIFHELYTKEGAIWSLLMAAGYVKPLSFNYETEMYEIALTNLESKKALEKRISEWFGNVQVSKNKFISALLQNNLDEMNNWMSDITKTVFSYFDTKKQKYEKQESFYHAFVLGLIVDLQQYEITSNGDSGYGRYDIMLIPKNSSDHGIVIEFKTHNSKKEKNLNVTCSNALKQIYEKEYITKLKTNGILLENIYVYGFAFNGKHVQILGGNYTDIYWNSFID